jgi:hypothetical protein
MYFQVRDARCHDIAAFIIDRVMDNPDAEATQ